MNTIVSEIVWTAKKKSPRKKGLKEKKKKDELKISNTA